MNIRQRVNRPTPKMPTQVYKTFRVASPVATHFRQATCQEFECTAFNNGWTYIKEELEKENLLYAVTHAGKRYKEMVVPVPIQTENGWMFGPEKLCLVFEPGQVCFQARTHRLPIGRPEFYFVGRGDYRSFTPRAAQQFNRPDDWLDSFQNHMDKIKTEIQKG